MAEHTHGGAVFRLHHKFADKARHGLTDYVLHDRQRHQKMFSGVDFAIGGLDQGIYTALYFVKMRIGTPSQDYYLLMDTGSDITWMSCYPCLTCPNPNFLGGDLRLYDLQNSSTASPVMCGERFCNIVAKYDETDCNFEDQCPYGVSYGDGSKTAGYLATDDFYLNTVVANLKTQLAKIAIHFGCGNHQSNSLQVTNGLLGLGRADTSFISQLASAGKSPKAFAHCLDGNTPGGIFVVGHVVEPSIKMIPLVPHETFYLVKLEGINIAGVFIKSTGKQEVIIDSGTTLALLPKDYSKSLISMIMAIKGVIELPKGEQELDKCFLYNGSVNHAFPTISFLFEGSTSITINPSDYIFSISENTWCVGWQSIPHSNSKRDRIILGDSILKNKLFVFDLEKQQIGWKDHNC